MIDPIFHNGNYQLARKLLDASSLRQQAIASNIANSETPGYRRLEIAPNFANELRSAVESGDNSGVSNLSPSLVQDSRARTVRPDGNSVEIEHEMLEMNRNTVEYDYLTDLVSNNIKQMKLAITGR